MEVVAGRQGKRLSISYRSADQSDAKDTT